MIEAVVPETMDQEMGLSRQRRQHVGVGHHSVLGRFLQRAVFEKRTFGGCDENDVMAKLEELALLYEDEIAGLRADLERERKRAEAYAEQSAAVRRVLSAAASEKEEMEEKASRAAKAVVTRAARDAHLAVANARAEADAIVRAAQIEADRLLEGAQDMACDAERRLAHLETREEHMRTCTAAQIAAVHQACEEVLKAVESARCAFDDELDRAPLGRGSVSADAALLQKEECSHVTF